MSLAVITLPPTIMEVEKDVLKMPNIHIIAGGLTVDTCLFRGVPGVFSTQPWIVGSVVFFEGFTAPPKDRLIAGAWKMEAAARS